MTKKIRREKNIPILHSLGISVSYERVIKLETLLTSAVCKQFKDQGVVCPGNLPKINYLVGAFDNILHQQHLKIPFTAQQ